MSIDIGVIPAAGWGTRMHPAISDFPKELLPIGDLPMIAYSINEALKCHLKIIYVIVRPEKKRLIKYLEGLLKEDKYRELKIIIAFQESADGLAAAILSAADLENDASMAVLLPDNIVLDENHPTTFLIEEYSKFNSIVLNLQLIEDDFSSKIIGNCGNVQIQPYAGEGNYRILDLASKGDGHYKMGGDIPEYRTTGRFIVNKNFYDMSRELKGKVNGELDDVYVLQKLIPDKKVYGIDRKINLYDVGNPAGYIFAQKLWIEYNR